MKKLTIDTTGIDGLWIGKFDFQLRELAPSRVIIKLRDLESYVNNEIVLKRTKKSNYPFLPVIFQANGESEKRINLGLAQAMDLLEVILTEETADATLVGYVSMSNGKFRLESPIRLNNP